MELQVGELVLTNSGQIGKVIQVWHAVACVEIKSGKTTLTISYPTNQLICLGSIGPKTHQVANSTGLDEPVAKM